MKTDSIDKNVEFSDAVRSLEDIKASYPDEWIVLGNPEKDEFNHTIAKLSSANMPTSGLRMRRRCY